MLVRPKTNLVGAALTTPQLPEYTRRSVGRRAIPSGSSVLWVSVVSMARGKVPPRQYHIAHLLFGPMVSCAISDDLGRTRRYPAIHGWELVPETRVDEGLRSTAAWALVDRLVVCSSSEMRGCTAARVVS